MGMMAKMRSLAPWFIITVGGLFVLFMVLSDSQIVNIMGQRSNNVGYVNDREITYQEFSNYLETVRRQQQAQTGQDIDENQMEALRDQVWSALVNQIIVEQKIDEFGIVVTDEEVKEEILGPNPPSFLRQSFIDSTGVFNREAYEQALFDPRNAEILVQAEATVRSQMIQDKLKQYLSGSIVVSEGEVRRQFLEQNLKMSAEYAFVDVNRIPDSLITVTDEDLKDYYDENKADYKVEPQRKLKYVLFERNASQEDSVSIKKNLEAIVEDLKADTASFRMYVNIYSEQPYSTDTLSVDKVHPKAVEMLRKAEEGDIIGPVVTTEGYTVYNLIDKFSGSKEFANASHILVSGTSEESKEKADSIYNALMNGADFSQTAIEVSEDPGSGSRGGELGWFSKGQMVPEFEQAVFGGKVGEIQKPIRTQFGYHIIKVADKTSEQYIVEKIVNAIQPSGTTVDRLYENATDFSYLAKENSFESEAELMGYDVVETQSFADGAGFIPGLGASSALVRFTFDNSVGDISDVYRVPAGYVVAKISDATKAGFKSFEELNQQLTAAVKRQKKLDKSKEIAQEVHQKIKDDGTLTNAPKVNPAVTFDVVSSFTPKGNIPGIGRDNAFIAYCMEGPIKEISEPIVGNRGSFLIRLASRTDFDEKAFETQKKTIRDNLIQQKRQQFFAEWIQKVREDADIIDNRHVFYR